jgi:hypothetical protein
LSNHLLLPWKCLLLLFVACSASDQIIADRRKEQQQLSKRGPKKVGTADRAVATGRAKRDAAANARRGITETKKPDPMAVEREVYRQSRQTEAAKEKRETKATGGRIAPNSTSRRNRKKKDASQGGTAPVFQAPSKKVVAAAVVAMKNEGYVVPQGMQVVINIVPRPQPAAKPAAKPATKSPPKKPQNSGNSNGGNSNNQGNKPTGNGRPNNRRVGNRKS